MLGIEDLLSELGAGEEATEQGLPPGFRFHPTDEELVTFYLASKIFNGACAGAGFFGVHIAEVDLNRCEPWEFPERAKMGEREWYFYSLRDRKYPTGLRTNRATAAGYWKATGKDKEVYSRSIPAAAAAAAGNLVGMKKTLVFYKGRAPRGIKTKWVMHEYRLEPALSIHHTYKQQEWVMCRVFHKAGEKRNAGVQIQNHQSARFNPQVNASLPILETPKPQNPSDHQYDQHENPQLKTLTSQVQIPCYVPKQCKTESVFTSALGGTQRYSDELNYSFQDPLSHQEGYSLLGLVPSPGDDDVAAALNRVGFHIMLDSISLSSGFPAAESWPLN